MEGLKPPACYDEFMAYKTDDYLRLDGVRLECRIYEPRGPKKSTIVFIPGISAHIRDYDEFLDDLASSHRVIAYNLRGHGTSQGTFAPHVLAEDLKKVIDALAPVNLLGHSLGAGIAAIASKENCRVRGVFMLAPYLGVDVVSASKRAMLYAARVFAAIPTVEDLVLHYGAMYGLKFHNHHPMRDLGRLTNMKSEQCRTLNRVAFIIPDHDEVLGTYDYEQSLYVNERLIDICPRSEDHSILGTGLNHCFNLKRGDYRPFLKRENKPRDQILQSITNFYEGITKPLLR